MASPRGAEGGMASARSRFLLAAAAVLGGLLAGLDVDRTLVAPIMLGIRDAADPASLQTALAGFRFWGDVRGALQLIAFVATVSALSRPG